MYQILQTLQIDLSNIFIICFKNCTEYFNLINQAPTYKISNTSDVIFITQQRDIATVHKIIHSWRGNFPRINSLNNNCKSQNPLPGHTENSLY